MIENQGKVFTTFDVGNTLTKRQKSITFLSFAKEQIETLLKLGRIGNSIAYKCAVSKMEKYIGKKTIRFEDIDFRFLEDFTHQLINQGLSLNGIASYMREIRAIYNKAIKMDLVEAKYYPFLKYKIKTEKTINRTLTLEEMKAIANLDLTDHLNLKLYQNLFLLSFCLIGINFADMLVLKAGSLVNKRVIFHRKKTGKIYSIKLHCKTIELMESVGLKIEQDLDAYLLPFIDAKDSLLKQKNVVGLVIHATNDNLKTIAKMVGISKPVSTYYARYSWANIAKSLNFSKDMIAEALGHEFGNRITGIYLEDFDKEIVDDMNECVISSLF